MKMSLYEISAEMLEILSCEEWTEEQEEKIFALGEAFESKVDAITKFQDNLAATSEAIDKEIKRLQGRKKAMDNRHKALSEMILRAMKATGRTEIDLQTRVVKIQKNPPAVNVTDEASIPARFWVIIPETKQLDKVALKLALKTEDIDGAELVQGERVVIK